MKIHIHPTLYAYLLALSAFSSWQSCLGAAAALCIHEAAHCLAGMLLREKVAALELSPLGGMMTYAEGYQPKKGVCGVIVAASGPAANYMMLLILADRAADAHSVFLKAFAAANFTMMCINLLPVLPLDGGRIVFSMAYYVFRALPLITLLTACGMLCGLIFILLAILGFCLTAKLNCSMIIIGVYLILCAKASRSQMIAENLAAVLQEGDESDATVQKARVYLAVPSVPLHNLIGMLSSSNRSVFVFEDSNGMHVFSERDVCKAAFESPFSTIGEAFYKKTSI